MSTLACVTEGTGTTHRKQIVRSPVWAEMRHQSNRGQLDMNDVTLSNVFSFLSRSFWGNEGNLMISGLRYIMKEISFLS